MKLYALCLSALALAANASVISKSEFHKSLFSPVLDTPELPQRITTKSEAIPLTPVILGASLLKIDYVPGNCQVTMIGGRMTCTQIPDRIDQHCYMFKETPGGNWCMRVSDTQTLGPYVRFGA